MKIAVFSYDYPSMKRTYVSSLCDMLVNSGHEVHQFGFYIHDPYDSFEVETNVSYIPFLIITFRKKISRILSKYFPWLKSFLVFLYVKYNNSNSEYILNKELFKINKDMQNLDTFDCSIGIEKGGIICAYQLYKIHRTPFFYFSLELYDESHPAVLRSTKLKLMRYKEVIAHKEAAGTIIADEDRKNFLYKTGEINPEKPAFYLPISFNEKYYEKNIPIPSYTNLNKKVILNFGYNRMPDDFFISLIRKMPNEFIFLMHNFDTKYHEEISREHLLNNIQFSNKLEDENAIMKIINKSFIGICWYQDGNANDRLIAFSSEKTARYLAAGKPIIANAKTNFTHLFSLYKCGIAVNTPEEFIDALHKISDNYQVYSLNARKAYDQIYKLSNYQQLLDNFLLKYIII